MRSFNSGSRVRPGYQGKAPLKMWYLDCWKDKQDLAKAREWRRACGQLEQPHSPEPEEGNVARKLGGGGGRAGHATPGEPRDYKVMKAKSLKKGVVLQHPMCRESILVKD